VEDFDARNRAMLGQTGLDGLLAPGQQKPGLRVCASRQNRPVNNSLRRVIAAHGIYAYGQCLLDNNTPHCRLARP
jgi:hypothetical protein